LILRNAPGRANLSRLREAASVDIDQQETQTTGISTGN
jgi:hypothetical protein